MPSKALWITATWAVTLICGANSFTVDTVFTGVTFNPPECLELCTYDDHDAFTSHKSVTMCLDAMPQTCSMTGLINTVIRANEEDGKYPICLDNTTGFIGFDLSAWIDFVKPSSVNLYGIKPEDTSTCNYHVTQLQTVLGEDDCVDERGRNIPRKILPRFGETDNGYRIGVDLDEHPLSRLYYRYQLTYTVDLSGYDGDVRAQGVILDKPAATPTPSPIHTTTQIEIPPDNVFLPCHFYPEAEDYRDIRIQFLSENTTVRGRKQEEGVQVSVQIGTAAVVLLFAISHF